MILTLDCCMYIGPPLYAATRVIIAPGHEKPPALYFIYMVELPVSLTAAPCYVSTSHNRKENRVFTYAQVCFKQWGSAVHSWRYSRLCLFFYMYVQRGRREGNKYKPIIHTVYVNCTDHLPFHTVIPTR